jgi:hypothetical protein
MTSELFFQYRNHSICAFIDENNPGKNINEPRGSERVTPIERASANSSKNNKFGLRLVVRAFPRVALPPKLILPSSIGPAIIVPLSEE